MEVSSEDLVRMQILSQEFWGRAWESACLTGSGSCCWSAEHTLHSEQGGKALLLLLFEIWIFLPLSSWH